MEELAIYDPVVAETLLQEVKEELSARGIILGRKAVKNDDLGADGATVDNVDWVRPFFIDEGESAFYLKLNSADSGDIATINEGLEKRLTRLQEKLKQFLENNDNIDEALRSKISTFATSNLNQAKKAVKFGLKKGLISDAKECNSMEDLFDAAGKRYANFVRQELLERILIPLYEGLQAEPGEGAYLFTLKQMNELLSGLGVYTVPIGVGEVYDDNSPYTPSDESQEAKYQTDNIEDKDKVYAILSYAYAFQEDKGVNNRHIKDGSVIVRAYRPGGVS